jgi:isoleucyl-tRNA synthetase
MTEQTEEKSNKNQFPAMEEAVLDFWEQNDIFAKSVNRAAKNGDYVFYDGPPFATGTPHYGHIVASLMKDVVPRYWTMNGYRVERIWGWDCHGLPIENIVEKEMGTKSKRDIENLGVDKFNESCRSKVLGYVDDWQKTVRRMGRWVDMEHSYKTMDLNYMESVWQVFKQMWDKDLIYEGYRSMHICPRCETTLSQSEVTEGYKDIKDMSVTAKFELLDESDTYFLAWTTTPWTLIGNVALAVGAKMDYVKVKDATDGKNYILAKELVEKVLTGREYRSLAEMKGKDLVGKKYQPLFDYYAIDEKLENQANGWQVYAADFVNTQEGTGIVHIAPAFGEDDLALGKENNLPFVQHVGMDGQFKPEVVDFVGLHVKPLGDHMSTDIEILKYLTGKDKIFAKAKYEHSYPHCWRCETPLINYATNSWFVNVTKLKTNALHNAEAINWSPNHIKAGRFGNWLEGARDWSISRQRFWASVLPIWKCVCGEIMVFGSVQELETASGQTITDLHKHVVDKITVPCAKCKQQVFRVPDVLDCWFESGSMPYAQLHYPFENKEKVDKNFPAKFIAEGVDQTRAWFYYLHIIATAIKDSRAFDNVIVNGIVLAEDGKKMSKKLQNYPDPNLLFAKYSADALRAYLLTAPVMQAENLNFSEKGVEESLRKNMMILWNVYNFYAMYTDDQVKGNMNSQHILDRWIIARLNQTVLEVTKQMDQYDLPRSMRPITELINDLSTWYLRRSRDRFKTEGADKQAVLATTKYVLVELAKLMAPFMPFIAENLWQKVSGYDFNEQTQSVHLENWPQAVKIDQTVLAGMEIALKVVEQGLAARDKAKLKVRQPLNKLTVHGKVELSADLQTLLAEELNIKTVELVGGDELFVELDLVITPELRAQGMVRELVRTVNILRKDADLSIADRIIVHYETSIETIKQIVEASRAEIMNDTLADDLILGNVDGKTTIEFADGQIDLSINKVG